MVYAIYILNKRTRSFRKMYFDVCTFSLAGTCSHRLPVLPISVVPEHLLLLRWAPASGGTAQGLLLRLGLQMGTWSTKRQIFKVFPYISLRDLLPKSPFSHCGAWHTPAFQVLGGLGRDGRETVIPTNPLIFPPLLLALMREFLFLFDSACFGFVGVYSKCFFVVGKIL